MGNGELASLAYGSLKELHKIEELYQREELIWGEIRGPFGGFRADFSTPFLPLFLGSIFMVLFRSAIAPEIACFIGVFGNWPPV